jgi:glucose/arabinose dehydrogenase
MSDPVYGLLGPNPPHRGAVLRIDPVSGTVEDYAGGVRTPNGLGIGPDGELFVTDNQGAWLPANKLIHVQQGHFYGHYLPRSAYKNMPRGGASSPFQDQPVSPPAIWLPHGEVSNSPTQFVLIPDGPFKNQLYMGELTQGGVRRLFPREGERRLPGCRVPVHAGSGGRCEPRDLGPGRRALSRHDRAGTRRFELELARDHFRAAEN